MIPVAFDVVVAIAKETSDSAKIELPYWAETLARCIIDASAAGEASEDSESMLRRG